MAKRPRNSIAWHFTPCNLGCCHVVCKFIRGTGPLNILKLSCDRFNRIYIICIASYSINYIYTTAGLKGMFLSHPMRTHPNSKLLQESSTINMIKQEHSSLWLLVSPLAVEGPGRERAMCKKKSVGSALYMHALTYSTYTTWIMYIYTLS